MYSYTPKFIPQRILVVGCGGTGSRLIPQIAQFIKTCPWIINPEMVIVDNDEVEEKNLRRQNFVAQDVGKKKATVLAQRYSKAYNLSIIPVLEMVTDETSVVKTGDDEISLGSILKSWGNQRIPTMAIMCVDSAEARRTILSTLGKTLSREMVLIIDTGNENDFGQVKMASLMAYYLEYSTHKTLLKNIPDTAPGTYDLPYLPLDIDYFNSMVSSAAPSCADLDQTMAINSLVATIAFGLIQNWYYAKPITVHKINISLAHGCIPEYMNNSYMHRICIDSENYYNKSQVRNGAHANFGMNHITRTLNLVNNDYVDYKRAMDAMNAENAKKAAGEAKAEAVAAVNAAGPKKASRKAASTAEVVEAVTTGIASEETGPIAA